MTRRPEFEIEAGGRKIKLGPRTLIMGVLNVTPDSFSDGGRYFDPLRAVKHGVELVRQGADWIDVGGESTRPGSQPVTPEEELRRVLPVIRELRRKLPDVPISIDTTKAEVAEQALEAGAGIVNDISGLRFEPQLADVARRHRAPLILMHTRGRPAIMQTKAFVQDIWRSLTDGFETSIRLRAGRGRGADAGHPRPRIGFRQIAPAELRDPQRPRQTSAISPCAPRWRLAQILRTSRCRRRRIGLAACAASRVPLLAHDRRPPQCIEPQSRRGGPTCSASLRGRRCRRGCRHSGRGSHRARA